MDKEVLRDKIRGMFLGIAIGDAIGMPVETFTAEEITRKYGRITAYLRPDGHKWFDGYEAGCWTDDTQLSLAVAESLIRCGKLDMEDMAWTQLMSYHRCSLGFGKSTRLAMERLARGVPWSESGKPESPRDGTGNGVVMKIAPLAAYFLASIASCAGKEERAVFHERITPEIIKFTSHTHDTNIAKAASFIHWYLLCICLESRLMKTGQEFLEGGLHKALSLLPGLYAEGLLNWDDEVQKLTAALAWVIDSHNTNRDNDDDPDSHDVWKDFGGGSSYLAHSLPFSYAFFACDPRSIESLYDVVSAGGDTDSNGSIVGAMLGALNGAKIFPRYLIDGLWRKDEIFDVADRFCDAFIK